MQLELVTTLKLFIALCAVGFVYGMIVAFLRPDGSFSTERMGPPPAALHFLGFILAGPGCLLSIVQTARSIRAIGKDDAGTLRLTPVFLVLHTFVITLVSIILIVVVFGGYTPVAVVSAIHLAVQLPSAAFVITALFRHRRKLLGAQAESGQTSSNA